MTILDGTIIQGSVDSINTYTSVDTTSGITLSKTLSIFTSYPGKSLIIPTYVLIHTIYASVFKVNGTLTAHSGSMLIYGNVIIYGGLFDVTSTSFVGTIEFVNIEESIIFSSFLSYRKYNCFDIIKIQLF